MPDVYYHCHNCGSIHEAEAIRLNLHLAGNPLGDAWFPRRSLLGWLEHRRFTALLMRGLWPAGAARNGHQRSEATCRSTVGLLARVAARSGTRESGACGGIASEPGVSVGGPVLNRPHRWPERKEELE